MAKSKALGFSRTKVKNLKDFGILEIDREKEL